MTIKHRKSAFQGDQEIETRVTGIGAQGDGIIESAGRKLFVALTAPGDVIRALLPVPVREGQSAELVAVLTPGAARGEPPCPHFGRCGGCRLQHLTDQAYADWKVERLVSALTRAGVSDGYELLPLVRTPAFARRRATFAVVRLAGDKGGVLIGFNARKAHEIADMAVCHVLDPRILALLPALRRFLARFLLPRQRAGVAVTLLDGGLDAIVERPGPLTLGEREDLAAFAAAADIARLSRRATADAAPEPVVQRRPVGAMFGGLFVAVPPSAFLQASREGEAALTASVRTACGGARSVADLFAGAGTFALPLAAGGARVHAVDADEPALRALAGAAVSLPGVSTEDRDLFARPLTPAELKRFDAVVFDPPRAGAHAQAAALAQSEVPLIVAVSCNPDSFARDARLLGEGGYRLERVVPIDQFLWSPHLELVAVFRRLTPFRRRSASPRAAIGSGRSSLP